MFFQEHLSSELVSIITVSFHPKKLCSIRLICIASLELTYFVLMLPFMPMLYFIYFNFHLALMLSFISIILQHFYNPWKRRKSQGWNIICSSLSISISHCLQIQRAEISFSAHHQAVKDVFALTGITVSSFSNCQKHEDITVRRRDEDIIVSSFSLNYTWRNDLRLHNRMILMTNYTNDTVWRQIKIQGPHITRMPLKWTLSLH